MFAERACEETSLNWEHRSVDHRSLKPISVEKCMCDVYDLRHQKVRRAPGSPHLPLRRIDLWKRWHEINSVARTFTCFSVYSLCVSAFALLGKLVSVWLFLWGWFGSYTRTKICVLCFGVSCVGLCVPLRVCALRTLSFLGVLEGGRERREGRETRSKEPLTVRKNSLDGPNGIRSSMGWDFTGSDHASLPTKSHKKFGSSPKRANEPISVYTMVGCTQFVLIPYSPSS